MKKICQCLFIFTVAALLISTCSKDSKNINNDTTGETGNYIDGVYCDTSSIDHEGYSTEASIEVTRGFIKEVNWGIYDNHRHRYFDDTYEEVYPDNPHYQQQCRDNMVGMKAYGPRLIETQDINQVDNISGATWCYKKFKQIVTMSLQDAYKDTSDGTE